MPAKTHQTYHVKKTLDQGFTLYGGSAIAEAGFTQAQLIDLGQRAFGMHVGGSGSFPSLVGVAYGPGIDSRQDHILIADGKKPIGMVLTYPRTYTLPEALGGKDVLTLGVGTVSTDPDYRGQGVMSSFMKASLERAKEEGAAYLFLGGQRQRYETFGFANASPSPHYEFNKRNFRGIQSLKPSQIVRVPHDEVLDYEDLPKLYECFKTYQRITARPTLQNFAQSVRMWEYDILVLHDEEDTIQGYVRYKKGQTTSQIEELCLPSTMLIPLLSALCDQNEKQTLSVTPSSDQLTLQLELAKYCENSSLEHQSKNSFIKLEQSIQLALAQYPFALPPYQRRVQATNALGEEEMFFVPSQSEGAMLHLTYQEFLSLFSIHWKYVLRPEIQVALAPLLPLTLPNLYADHV